ncbi:DUF2927 domain-containing protein [Jannaschia aquimarina]|uniref:DUF2927 domain-containing protein n=1 Tax=Jannaschia aquimarina TaxID=935700 RepID=A0A0D1CM77_9RHOB|nr:DUF2927 domain-containing protein [Jannaschia aquimarina]KIT15847.1 hypothetical protein jaqu_24270 [Jannaschia aquimarina]SNT09937.1 Protein of unknown function [Jannaschia aquimarina]
MTKRALLSVVFGAFLTGCQPTTTSAPDASPPPPPRPEAGPSGESRALSGYYRRIESRLLADGRLRRDGLAPDAPFGAAQLARNFERIALFSEYTQIGGRYVAQQSRAKLRRWPGPVRVQLHFGESVDPATRRTDRLRVESYLARLRRATNHPIRLVDEGGNYHVFVASLDEQRELGPQISRVEPGLSRTTIREITSLGRNTYCAVYASSTSDRPNAYVSAIALIRSEHPDLMRLSCYHEEIAQGLGLANDSPVARPSIFNDDEEFALLTRHDEELLGMLYDSRLRIGMTAEQAAPIIRRLAEERAGGGPV